MSPRPQTQTLCAALLLLIGAPLHALTSAAHLAPFISNRVFVQPGAPELSLLGSLREEIAKHPGFYLPFETELAARRFIAEHSGASRETDRTMVLRGVLGYWGGKTIAVVPSIPLSMHGGRGR